jgi:DNA polymerase III gamma/tau subunit
MLGLIRGTIGEFRNLLVARIDPALLSRDLAQSDAERVVALAAATPQAKVVRGLRLLADALAAGRSSGNPRLELETAVLRLALAAEDQSLESIGTRLTLLEQAAPGIVPAAALGAGISAAPPAAQEAPVVPVVEKPLSKAAPKPEPALKIEPVAKPEPPAKTDPAPSAGAALQAEPKPKAEPQPRAEPEPQAESPPDKPGTREPIPAAPVTLQRVRSLWDQIRLRAEERQKPLKGPLSRATVDAVDADSLTIGVSDALHEGIARDKLSIIEDAVADVVGRRLRIVIRARTPATSAHRAPPPAASASAPAASASAPDGEVDLLAYARKKLGGTETT